MTANVEGAQAAIHASVEAARAELEAALQEQHDTSVREADELIAQLLSDLNDRMDAAMASVTVDNDAAV